MQELAPQRPRSHVPYHPRRRPRPPPRRYWPLKPRSKPLYVRALRTAALAPARASQLRQSVTTPCSGAALWSRPSIEPRRARRQCTGPPMQRFASRLPCARPVAAELSHRPWSRQRSAKPWPYRLGWWQRLLVASSTSRTLHAHPPRQRYHHPAPLLARKARAVVADQTAAVTCAARPAKPRDTQRLGVAGPHRSVQRRHVASRGG